jgi:hypothetical protein
MGHIAVMACPTAGYGLCGPARLNIVQTGQQVERNPIKGTLECEAERNLRMEG